MMKWVRMALVIAGIGAFAVGVLGGWAMGHDYYALKRSSAASR